MRSYYRRVLGYKRHLARNYRRLLTSAPMPFILAFRNLVHDKTRLTATLAGLTFAVVLVGVQLGLYLGVRKIITDMIDHTDAQLWIVPFGTQSIEDAFPLLGAHERQQALAAPGVERVIPLVVSFADWDRPDGGITHVVVVGSDAEEGGLAPWNLRSGDWTDIKSYKSVGVDRTYLDELGVTGIGSRAGIDFGPQSHSLRVKALTDGIRSFTQAPYVFTTNARAREFFGVPNDNSTFLLVKTAPHADLGGIQKEIAARLPDLEVLTGDEFRRRSISHWLFRTGVGLALIFGTILGVVIGAVVEAQTLYSAALDHIKEFAVLRMLGSSARYVYRIILVQASLISLAGFALGAVLVALVDRLSQQTALPMVVPPSLFWAMLAVSLAIGAFSTIIAVMKVLRVDPAAVLMR
jgi:putative ABC transport system permease protein